MLFFASLPDMAIFGHLQIVHLAPITLYLFAEKPIHAKKSFE